MVDDAGHAPAFADHLHKEWYTEWWYFNVRDPKTGLALLAMFEASPFGVGIGVFAAMVFAKGAKPFDVADPYPRSQITISASRADVQIGPNRVTAIDADHYRIQAASRDGRLAFDLTLTRVPGAPPAWLLHNAQGPLSWEVGYWMSWLPHARASGTITIDGTTSPIEAAAAYHDHNWGVWCSPLRNWQWLECSSATAPVALDLGYSDGFDPPRTALLDLDGQTYRFDAGGISLPTYSSWQTWHDSPYKSPERAKARLVDTTGNVRLDLEWHAPPGRTLPLSGASIVLFEQHVQVTMQIEERGPSGAFGPPRTFELDGIAEWSESIFAAWTTGEGLLGGYTAEATVFGAGVTGLTVAHELVERGFAVTVVEAEVALDRQGHQALAVGGMARSHYARVPRLGAAPPNRPAGRPTADSRDDRFDGATVTFAADSAEVPAAAEPALAALARAFRDRYCDQGYRLRLVGSAAPIEKEAKALAARRAEAVRDRLASVGIGPDLLVLDVDPARRTPITTVGLEDWVLPGEHGFRFFPSYYRHLTDTMSRTPTYDREGRQDGGRVLDKLRPTPASVMLKSGQAPTPPPGTDMSALQLLRMAITAFGADAYDPRDFLQLGLRITRYLATCPDRRRALEALSWWAYLMGYCPKTGCYLYRYSDAFSIDATASGRVLAAFDWRYGDARTNGSTWIQLMEPLPDAAGQRFDGTLDAPTSEAWFDHWRRYLDERGVRFISASLERLERERHDGHDTVVPWIRRPGQNHVEPLPPRTRRPRYVVVATDAPTAERVSAPLPQVGVPKGLVGYTTEYDGKRRDPYREPGLGKNDRFQTLSGVQYFFDQSFAIATHAYSLDAPWSLTSLSMQRAWSKLPISDKDGFAGLLSVDIGDFRVPAGPNQITAWDSSKERLGEEVWLQLSNDLRTDAALPLRLPRPRWFHVDDNLEFGDRDGKTGVIVRNATPYLVPITADWERRPGSEPFDPNVPERTRPETPAAPGVWAAPHGGYPVHFDCLVYGGIYLKTFTRMTTMESANESGRHAVNAILDHYNAHHAAVDPPATPPPKGPANPLDLAADEVPPAFLGDYCGIWNIERYEPSAFDRLKAIDQVLHDLGLPHLFDLTGVELVPSILSHIFPYRGDCSPISEAPPKPVPPPSPWCPPFVGELLRRWRSR
jgi:outer membrane protein OmpA-like peptidoglycan-associated protein